MTKLTPPIDPTAALPDIVQVKPKICTVSHAGLALNYLVWGDMAKPAILLLHGGKDHCRNWDWTVAGLIDDYCCITPDLRGHGQSSWPVGVGYDTPLLVADLAAVIEDLAKTGFSKPLHLIGHSLGGIIVLNYAATRPDRVASVIAMEGLGASPATHKTHLETPPAKRLGRYVEKLLKHGQGAARFYQTPEEMVVRMASAYPNLSDERVRHLSLHGARHYSQGWRWKYDLMMAFVHPVWMTSPDDYGKLFAAITAPTLLMRGADSWASDPREDGRIKPFQRAEFITLPKAGHWLHHDQFDLFLEAVTKFVGGAKP